MSKYDEFDKALLDLIANGYNTLTVLDTDKTGLRALAEPHRTNDRFGKTPYFRVIDRRLQALRKVGKIHYQDKRWSVA